MVPFALRRTLGATLILLAGTVASAQVAPKIHYSTARRDSAFRLQQTLTGPAKLTARLSVQRSAISVAATSFHRNGTQDLLTGYATSTGGALVLQNGAPEALAPTPREMPAIVAGQPIVSVPRNFKRYRVADPARSAACRKFPR